MIPRVTHHQLVFLRQLQRREANSLNPTDAEAMHTLCTSTARPELWVTANSWIEILHHRIDFPGIADRYSRIARLLWDRAEVVGEVPTGIDEISQWLLRGYRIEALNLESEEPPPHNKFRYPPGYYGKFCYDMGGEPTADDWKAMRKSPMNLQ